MDAILCPCSVVLETSHEFSLTAVPILLSLPLSAVALLLRLRPSLATKLGDAASNTDGPQPAIPFGCLCFTLQKHPLASSLLGYQQQLVDCFILLFSFFFLLSRVTMNLRLCNRKQILSQSRN